MMAETRFDEKIENIYKKHGIIVKMIMDVSRLKQMTIKQ